MMSMMRMMNKGRRGDVRPLLIKVGVALAISFAGLMYSRVRIKRIKPSGSPHSPPPSTSDRDVRVDHGGRVKIKEDPEPEMDSLSTNTYDVPCIRVRVDNSSVNTAPSVRCSGDKQELLLPELDQMFKKFDVTAANVSPKADIDTFDINKKPKKAIRKTERDDYKLEIESLKNMVKFLQERERKLEVELLEYYGVKEQESVVMELQNRLKINSIEAKLLSMKIKSLQADNKRLQSLVAKKDENHAKVVRELEAARMKITQLKRKIRQEAEQSKEQILELTQRVENLRCQEHEAGSNNSSDDHWEQQRVKELGHEAEELRKSNEKLLQANADLARRLELTQMLANSNLEDPEVEELHEERNHLREENENLSKEIERLQEGRCADAEELVYLRWINACLRYELRNYQPPPGKTVARDLSKSLSPNSELKAKQLILEYANTEDGDHSRSIVDFDFDQWPSSQPSYLTDENEHDDSPSSSSSKKRHTKKVKFFARLRRLIKGKHIHQNRSGGTSPLLRSLSVDDIGTKYSYESPRYGAGPDYQRSDSRFQMLTSSSQNSNTSSVDHQPLSSLAEEDAKDIETASRASESGCSQGGGVRFVLGKGSASSSPLDHRPEQEAEDGQKSELVKYAEVLRDSQWESEWVKRMHKKSASFSVA